MQKAMLVTESSFYGFYSFKSNQLQLCSRILSCFCLVIAGANCMCKKGPVAYMKEILQLTSMKLGRLKKILDVAL